MPCDTVYRISVAKDLSGKDRKILVASMKRAKWRVLEDTERRLTVTTTRGQLTFESGRVELRRGQEGLIEEIDRMYAEECIYVQAETHGWDVIKTGEHQFEVIREDAGGWDVR